MISLVPDCKVFVSELQIQNTQHHLDRLIKNVPWTYPTFFGKTVKRGVCSMGKDYAYSGQVTKAVEWDKQIHALMLRINELYGTNFNACLLNYYPDSTVSISKHSDNEKELVNPVIVVSVSLGAERIFRLHSKKGLKSVDIPLKDGTVLVMGEKCQSLWMHEIPKGCGNLPRISLTFRQFV
jgi:alkylated DNA repair dioxygenase AlkB